MKKIAIIEDNAGTRKVLADFLNTVNGFEVVFSAGSFEEFRKNWQEEILDMVLCDIGLPGKSGIEAAWYIKEVSPRTQVMMLTVFEDKEKIFQSLCSGASGYMLKSAPLNDIYHGMLDILDGGAAMSPKIALQVISFFNSKTKIQLPSGSANSRLTAREIELLALLEDGSSNRQIADALFLSIDTVKFHIKNIYLKLQVNSRSELLSIYRNFL